MPTTALLAPTNVTSQASGDGKKVTVSWQDPNPAASVDSYAISFVPKDSGTAAFKGGGTANAGATSADIARQTSDTPTANDLATKYNAQVVAKAKDTSKNSDSPPGVQGGGTQPAAPHWDINPSITIQLGDTSLTLTKSSGGGGDGKGKGKYVLPVSKDDPFTITYDEISDFAKTVSLPVPTTWPNGTPISGQLNVTKLAVDLDLQLFELDISMPVQWTPFPGLTVESLGLNVLRTDGTTNL